MFLQMGQFCSSLWLSNISLYICSVSFYPTSIDGLIFKAEIETQT